MNISRAQVAMFWRLWAEACDAQGWAGDERETERRAMLARCGFESLTHVDRSGGFDRVRAECLRLAHRLEGGAESTFPGLGEMRRHLHLIESRIIPALEAQGINADAYIARICIDRGWPRQWRTLADNPARGPGQAKQLLMTLTRAVGRKAGRTEQAAATEHCHA